MARITQREAAEIIGVTINTLFRWHKQGIGPMRRDFSAGAGSIGTTEHDPGIRWGRKQGERRLDAGMQPNTAAVYRVLDCPLLDDIHLVTFARPPTRT